MTRAQLRYHLMAGVIERVARSPEHAAFVLRGGMLTRAWVAPVERPTRDLDFVGDFAFDVDTTRERFACVTSVPLADGLAIEVASAVPMWVDSGFPGVRVELSIAYSSVDHKLTVDIGFNDPLIPPTVELPFDGTTARVDIRAVRPETQLAWKLHALAEMTTSWRPKDLHDAWLITSHVALDDGALGPAIVAAFESRGYARASVTGLFAAAHWTTKTSRLRWERPQPLEQIVGDVRTRLAATLAGLPMWEGTR